MRGIWFEPGNAPLGGAIGLTLDVFRAEPTSPDVAGRLNEDVSRLSFFAVDLASPHGFLATTN